MQTMLQPVSAHETAEPHCQAWHPEILPAVTSKLHGSMSATSLRLRFRRARDSSLTTPEHLCQSASVQPTTPHPSTSCASLQFPSCYHKQVHLYHDRVRLHSSRPPSRTLSAFFCGHISRDCGWLRLSCDSAIHTDSYTFATSQTRY